MSCNCFWGIPVEDESGCYCVEPCNPLYDKNCLPNGTPFPMTLQDSFKKRKQPPLSIIPTEPNLSDVKCSNLQAPAGYHYLWNGTNCNLEVDYSYSGSTPIVNTATRVTNAVQSATSQVSDLISEHKGLLAGAALLIGVFAFGHKKGATRERSVITRAY